MSDQVVKSALAFDAWCRQQGNVAQDDPQWTLARKVVEHAEQLAMLKAALREALDADADDCRSLGDKRRGVLRRLL